MEKWGDEAMTLGQYEEALLAYRLLKKSRDDDAVSFRELLATTRLQGSDKTLDEWKRLATQAQGIWRDAAKSETEYYKFSKGLSGI